MTNVQLWLAIGVPSFLVILSWLSNNLRQTTLETRLASAETRLEGRINNLQARMDQRFDILIDMNVKLHERVALVEAKQS